MQLAMDIAGERELLARIHARLLDRLGRLGPYDALDPVSQLVMSLIGGRTLGATTQGAFDALLLRWRLWEDVRDAPPDEIVSVIAEVTFAEDKARRLKQTLQRITRSEGALSLDRLDSMRMEAAQDWLERLPGVGRKVAAATLNFSTLRKRTLVIDCHHLRVLSRLGLVSPRATIAQAYDSVMPLLPAGWDAQKIDMHHQLMKRLGQRMCRIDARDCAACPLRALCPGACSGPGRRAPRPAFR